MGVGNLRKTLFLVPDADYKYSEEGIEEWYDTRPQPTQAELDVVTDQEVIDSEADTKSSQVIDAVKNKFHRLLFEINFKLENRVRVLEGNDTITKGQYKKAVKNLYKTL